MNNLNVGSIFDNYASQSAFGDLITTEITSLSTANFTYDILDNNQLFQNETSLTGSITYENSSAKASTGTTANAYALIRMKQTALYLPGFGTEGKLTAKFNTGVADSLQFTGLSNVENSIGFGYNGTDFGILLAQYGKQEIRLLTITTPASGSETATLTIDGTDYSVDLTSGTVGHNANEVATEAVTGWELQAKGATIYFVSNLSKPFTGSFTFTSSTAVGTFSTIVAGVVPTETWIPQSSWNTNRMDGTSRTNMVLNPQNFNVYKIQYQYLGAGRIQFFVEDDESGAFNLVHMIKYTNNNTRTSFGNPTFHIEWVAKSLGSTTNITISGGSCAASIQGKIILNNNPKYSTITSTTGIGTALTNIIAYRANVVFKSQLNHRNAVLYFISASSEASGNNTSEIHIIFNPTFGSDTSFSDVNSNSFMEISTAGGTITNGTKLITFALPKSGTLTEDISRYNIRLERSDVICIAVRATGGTVDVSIGTTWIEIL